MKIMLIGYGQSGKGTFCKVAEEAFGLESIASSLMACKLFLFEQIREKYGYATIEDCYNDRHSHRQIWYEAIRRFNEVDRSRLGQLIFQSYDIYDGCRDKEEFDALKLKNLFDIAIWVDADGRVEPEGKNSMTVTIEDADIVIRNSGSESDYNKRVYRTLMTLCK